MAIPGPPSAAAREIGVLLNRGVAAHQQGRLGEAEQCYRRVLAADGNQPDALHLLGVVAQQAGKPADAAALIRRAIAIRGNVALYHNNLGVALRAQGHHAEAVPCYRRAVALEPKYAEAWNNLGNALDAIGEAEESLAAYRRAVVLDRRDPVAHTGAGTVLVRLGRPAEAVAHFRAAAEADAKTARAHVHLANALIAAGDMEAALAPLERAVALEPRHAEARRHLGVILRERDRPAEAEPHLRAAVEADPADLQARHILGLSLRDQRRLDEAAAVLRGAADLAPDHADVHGDLANVLKELGQDDAALAAFDRALALDPESDTAASNRALLRLARGDFAGGWRDYLRRISVREKRATLHRDPLPADLSGRRALVLRDQGLGDEIFFLRFFAELKARGAWIAYRADPKVAGPIARLPFIDRMVATDEEPDGIDLRLSAGDLPALLGHADAAAIPPSVRLVPLAGARAAAAERLAAFGPPPYAGVTWRAGIQRINKLSKVAPREGLADALAPLDARVVVLQRAPEPGEAEAFAGRLGRPVLDLSALNDDLEAMLAVLDLLDEQVCVSNTNVHLRAGLGRASRVLVPFPPEFRWMKDGAQSPWFPGSPVYREAADGDWTAALAALARDLARDRTRG